MGSGRGDGSLETAKLPLSDNAAQEVVDAPCEDREAVQARVGTGKLPFNVTVTSTEAVKLYSKEVQTDNLCPRS